MVELRVSDEALRGLAGTVRARSGEVASLLGQLRGGIDATLGASWAGQASGAFQERFVQWQQGAQQLNDALQGLAVLLDRAAESYAATEEGIRQAFRT
ncbi:MAG: WXG100 family type VII secretion target [Actinomycetota bacterium]